MGGSYAFSLIGYSGKAGGSGDTEDARWTTAIKYRVNFGDWLRIGVMGQPIGGSNGGYNAYNPNNGAIAGDIGTDIRHLGPGMLSMDVVGTYERDAVNISAMYPGQALNANGTPTHVLRRPMPPSRQRSPTRPPSRWRANTASVRGGPSSRS